jgi:hypothetical protein
MHLNLLFKQIIQYKCATLFRVLHTALWVVGDGMRMKDTEIPLSVYLFNAG